MAVLIYQNQENKTQSYRIQSEHISLGRHNENDVVLDDVFVSRKHATIDLEDGSYVIRDLDSTYGLMVNNEKIKQSILKYGDQIQLGNTMLTLVEEKSSTTSETNSENNAVLNVEIEEIENIKHDIELLRNRCDTGETLNFPLLITRLTKMEETISNLQQKMETIEKTNKITSTLYEVGKIMNSVLELDRLLDLIMDLALEVMNAERGFIMLVDEKSGELKTKVARNMFVEDHVEGAHSISLGIASRVMKEKEPVITADASTDPRFSSQVSVIMYNIRSVMCVPLKTKDEIIGVIYVDNRVSKGYFSEEDLEFLAAFANNASLAIENAKLIENIRAEEKLRSNLQRYLPINLVDEMMDGNEFQLGGTHVKATMLFSDLKGFTSFSENLSPEETVRILNEFFSVMTDEVFRNEGTLDKYMGDGIMAIFGAPVGHMDDSLRACKSAIGMMNRLEELNHKWKKEGKPWNLLMKIGINTGDVVAGNVGSEKRMDYTVIGDAVNLTSRLENAADAGEIFITESTYNEIKQHVIVKKLDPITVKGKTNKIQIYQLLDITKLPT